MNTIYIEAFSGLSGNMFLSAFCELLGDYNILLDLPEKLHLNDAKIEIHKVDKNGINCNYIDVIDLNTDHNDNHTHSHSHHSHGKHHHTHNHSKHRHLKDIQAIIQHSHISENAKKIANDIFLIIGKAESKIHNIPLEKIHFHEISGVDSIIDIVGNAILIDKLNISNAVCTNICTGHGMVKTQHGMLPIPAPATAEILKGIPLYPGKEQGEKVTPTGAAVLKYLNPSFDIISNYTPLKTAYGPGKKDFELPNVVRITLLDNAAQNSLKTYLQIETSIDDMSPEFIGTDFQDGLLQAGALDFSISHEIMKKGRFGFIIKVISTKDQLNNISDYLFDNTSTIGLRFFEIQRKELPRKMISKKTVYGDIKYKQVTTSSGKIKEKAEFEDISKLSKHINKTSFQIKKNT